MSNRTSLENRCKYTLLKIAKKKPLLGRKHSMQCVSIKNYIVFFLQCSTKLRLFPDKNFLLLLIYKLIINMYYDFKYEL